VVQIQRVLAAMTEALETQEEVLREPDRLQVPGELNQLRVPAVLEDQVLRVVELQEDPVQPVVELPEDQVQPGVEVPEELAEVRVEVPVEPNSKSQTLALPRHPFPSVVFLEI
jgi:hypothetical protein